MTSLELLMLALLLTLWAAGLHLVIPGSNPLKCLIIVTFLFFFGFTLGLIGGSL